jgi:hypothetical protein
VRVHGSRQLVAAVQVTEIDDKTRVRKKPRYLCLTGASAVKGRVRARPLSRSLARSSFSLLLSVGWGMGGSAQGRAWAGHAGQGA